ncbi:hypothetical protein [Fibrobacter sp. UWB10]|uniref:hypothetical protein n=1 Tax=Fibrobacter sp. UWB10 TaxID=1896201 RepID=UPI0024035913|nr:hypothetical protein [Fibrobacter sp. UWB10]SMP40945.1 hypothetical protein SAMN05720465_0563 [Fibrobacter sp. UWB10]
MTIIRKVLTLCSVFMTIGFAQEFVVTSDSAAAANSKQDSIATAVTDSTDKPAVANNTAVQDTRKAAPVAKDTAAPQKMRNKITYADYQEKVKRSAKKRSKTMHHGLSLVGATYNDKNYWHMDHDANWGTGVGMYYFYRRYFGNYLGMQGRVGALYRYSRWTFDADEQEGKLSTGEKYKLTHSIDRKYHNIAADLPLTGKLGYHIKGTTTFLYTALTLGLTKPIYEFVDTENSLSFSTKDKGLKEDLNLINETGNNPFPLHESHQTYKFFYMDDWETNSWIGLGIESRLVSFEIQMFAFGGASQNANHRFHNIGQGSPTWRMFLDFSIR